MHQRVSVFDIKSHTTHICSIYFSTEQNILHSFVFHTCLCIWYYIFLHFKYTYFQTTAFSIGGRKTKNCHNWWKCKSETCDEEKSLPHSKSHFKFPIYLYSFKQIQMRMKKILSQPSQSIYTLSSVGCICCRLPR